MSEVAIERRDVALDRIVGTGDTRAALAELEQNVRDIINIARDRGFVTRFNNRDFFHFGTWSLLGSTYGLVPFIEWSRQIDGGWEARSVVRNIDTGREIAAAEAMCTRQESQHSKKADHDLRAMAQTRAMRNSLRACLGAALVMAGFDFADPEGPVTKDQLAVLHILEREIGWSHDEAHQWAGVSSYTELNREDAATLIDRWTAIRDEEARGESSGLSTPPRPEPSGEVIGQDSSDGVPSGAEDGADIGEASRLSAPGEPANATAWERATKAGLTARKALAVAKGLGFEVKSSSELTGEQLAKCLAAYQDGQK